MVYTFGLLKHANVHYRDSLVRLGLCELQAMLRALSVECDISVRHYGGTVFLEFDCRPLSESEISWLSGHSSVVFLAEKEGELLRPIPFESGDYLGEDLPEILKYKGKTSASFMRMMLNITLSLSSFSASKTPLTLLDPVCGKGTACFCALQAGMNAIGIDLDQKAVREAGTFFSRYLKIHLLKHSSRFVSETAEKGSVPVQEFVFADTREHYQKGETRFLRLAAGDTALSAVLCRRRPVHLILADLPYGIQHAPKTGAVTESFSALLSRALPVWKQCLLPGGAAAVSFNTLTFPTPQVRSIIRASGLTPVESSDFLHLRHEVEQAVVRDVVFMIRES